ncbi:MAG: hypothetical protein QXV17_05005 [Candidatus Micrarchaeaceae archaeon]
MINLTFSDLKYKYPKIYEYATVYLDYFCSHWKTANKKTSILKHDGVTFYISIDHGIVMEITTDASKGFKNRTSHYFKNIDVFVLIKASDIDFAIDYPNIYIEKLPSDHKIKVEIDVLDE